MPVPVDFEKAEKAYGTLRAWSDRLGIVYTTVHSWKRSGKVPDWREARIREVAAADDKDVFVTQRKRRSRSQMEKMA